MSRRRLKPEEIALWQEVTKNTDAMHRGQTFDPAAYAPAPAAAATKKPEPTRARVSLDGKSAPQPVPRKTSFDLVPKLPERLQTATLQMDRKTYARMNRGKVRPEAKMDLHGMTLDRAHGALLRFIMSSHGAGKRLVLVITGKGKDRDEGGPIPVRHGLLRHQVPRWLATQPCASVVLQVAPAHVSHGGGGAYYVYLKRKR
ncbi:MAG: Smr/MutS family protein [Roseobacter sp.]